MGRSKQQTAPFGISPHAFMTLVSPTLGHDLALAFLQWIEAGETDGECLSNSTKQTTFILDTYPINCQLSGPSGFRVR